MSLRKTRYIHYQDGMELNKFRGFTAKLSPHSKQFVCLSVAFCSKKDQFCRKTGRKAADEARAFIIPVTNVPMRLAEFRDKVWGDDWETRTPKMKQCSANAFAWIWKYFL